MKKKGLVLAMFAIFSGAASAADLDNIDVLNVQRDFRLLSEDLGAALSYKALTPAEPEGITGFDIGVEATVTSLENDKIFKEVTGGSESFIVAPKLHAHKGLPFGIDVGAFYSSVPDSNISLMGAELRYAIIEGNVALPAVAVRATYSTLGGVDQLDLTTKGLELTASKGFAMLTPYAGIGQIWVDSDPNIQGSPLEKESFTLPKYFVGANFNMGLLNLAFEGDMTGDATTYGAKIGFRF